jgi:transposase
MIFRRPTAVAIDETSYRRGHEYSTLVADMQARRIAILTQARRPAR